MTENPHIQTNLEHSVVSLVEETMESTDLFIVDVVVRGRQGSRIVEVFLDGDEGIGIDKLAKLSRRIAFLLESKDLIKGKYHLNVSSPGAERALMMPRQYAQHTGRNIELEIRSDAPEGAHITATGELVSNTEEAVVLQTDSGEKKQIPFVEIEKARIVTPW